MAENRFAKYGNQQPATNRFAKYAEADQAREKVFSKGGSALVGMGDMGSFGLRDEASGGQAARQSMAPAWLNRAMDSAAGGLPIVQAGIGAIDAGIGIATENTGNPGEKAYDDMVTRRDAQRMTNSVAMTDNPVSYLAGGIAGSVAAAPIPALGVGKSVVGTAAKVGGESAVAGGIFGFGAGEGDLGDRGMSAGGGALIGGGAGAVLGPAAQYVIGPVIKGLGYKAFTSADNKALDMVLRRAERSETSLDKVRADFETWSKTGEVPETLAELMGPNERGLLSALVTSNSGTRAKAGEVLLGRGRNEVNILERGFAKAMGAKGEDLPKAVASAKKARAEDPEAFYAPAHFGPDGSLKPLRPDQQSKLNNILVEEDDVVRILKDAQSDLNRSGNKSARDEVRLYREAMEQIRKGEAVSLPTLSVQAGDYIERSVNQSLKAAYGSSGTVSGSARGWRNQRDAIRSVIDDGTGVAEARATAAERIRRTELLDEGRKFLNPSTDVEDVKNVLRGDPELEIAPASTEGRQAYTAGAARGIRDKLENVPDMVGFADATRAVARTPAVRAKIAAVLPQDLVSDPSILAIQKKMADGKKLTPKQQKRLDDYGKNYAQNQGSKQTRLNNELDETIERVSNRSEFTTNMLGNSRTAFRQADMADAAFDDTLAQSIGDATSDLLIRGPGGAVAGAMQKFGQGVGNYIARPGVMNPKINDATARILLAQGEAIPQQLQRLAARQLKRGGKPNPGNALAIGAGKAPAAKPKGPVRGAGWTGERPVGFADELERGAEPFRDPRLSDYSNKMVEMAKNGYSNAEIAEELGARSSNNIASRLSQIRREYGIDFPRGKAWAPTTPERILMEKLIKDGLDNQQIAARTGKTPEHVRVVRSKLKNQGPAMRGIDAGSELSQFGVGAGIGAQGAQDLDGDGKISAGERAAGAAAGYGVVKGGPAAIRAALRAEGKSVQKLKPYLFEKPPRGKVPDQPEDYMRWYIKETDDMVRAMEARGGKLKPATAQQVIDAAGSRGAEFVDEAERLLGRRGLKWSGQDKYRDPVMGEQIAIGLRRGAEQLRREGFDTSKALQEAVRSEAKLAEKLGMRVQSLEEEAMLSQMPDEIADSYRAARLGGKGPVRGNGFTGGKAPKPPKPRLGRTLEDLMNEKPPQRLPIGTGERAPAPKPKPPAGEKPRKLSKEKPDPELEKLFSDLDGRTARNSANVPTGHYGKENNAGLAVISSLGLGLGAVGATSAYMTAKPADPNFKANRAKVLKQLADAPDSATWQNRIRQMDEFIASSEARMTELEAVGAPRQLMNARRKAVREASDAFASATDRTAVERAVARVEALDYAIDVTMGEGEPFKEAPTAPRPASLKNPVPAGINAKMVGRAAQMTGNALAMANDKATTGTEKAANYIAERLRTAELPKRPIDLLIESEQKRNRQGQFVRDMDTKRKNDELWKRNGYTGYMGRKMTPEERRAYGKGSR